MRIEYGVPVPRGVRKDWEVSAMGTGGGGIVLRKYHADPEWGEPKRCVAWFDRFERLRACVGHYANGRSAVVRINANGGWSTTFGRVPASVDTLPEGGDAQQAPCASKGSAVAATSGETPNGGTNG